MLRLTLLAPDIVEAILGGRQPAGLQLDGLLRRFPVEWREQKVKFPLSTLPYSANRSWLPSLQQQLAAN